MEEQSKNTPFEVLLVEDSSEDAYLTIKALKSSDIPVNVTVMTNGVNALKFLRKEDMYAETVLPDLVLLDLNLPRMDGREVLKEVKSDKKLKHIPVVILTTSRGINDIQTCYSRNANCYIAKPIDFLDFREVMNTLKTFWLTVVKLPKASVSPQG